MCYSPVRHSLRESRAFDLHVLGTPPAFIMSQDQTRHPNLYRISQRRFRCCVSELSPIDRLKMFLPYVPYHSSVVQVLWMLPHLVCLIGSPTRASEILPPHLRPVKCFLRTLDEFRNSGEIQFCCSVSSLTAGSSRCGSRRGGYLSCHR